MSALALRLGQVVANGRDRLGSLSALGSSAVPACIRAPRIIFLSCATSLLLFGFLMIYSSSSITGLTTDSLGNDPMYYLVRQMIFAGVGVVGAILLSAFDYHRYRDKTLRGLWIVTVVLLIAVFTPIAGCETNGASRWIAIGSFKLQPSEFAKVTVVLVGAYLAESYYAKGSLENSEALKLLAVGIGLPLFLILAQPDKGTCGIMVVTLFVMCYLCGVSGKLIVAVSAVCVLAALAWSLKDEYSRARILTVIDPFRDAYGDGYQLTQGFYAFGSGGLTGVGLGMSRQKYNYLPMAHNDFIFAIIGEELGFVGCLLLVVAFGVLLWSGLKIAENASDLAGRLIAAGCTSLLTIQLLLNLWGVVGIFPLSGKPVPFISYGGSSVICSCLLVGLTLSVSLRSELPETSYERRRSRLRVTEGGDDVMSSRFDEHGVSEPTPARMRPRGTRGLRVIEGGTSERTQPRVPELPSEGRTITTLGHARTVSRSSVGARYARVDLNPDPVERLRGRRSDRRS